MYGQSTSDEAITTQGKRIYKITVSEAGAYATNKHRTGYRAPIRQSNYTLTVPYDRFLPEMIRLHQSGAKIVNVTSVIS
ncbi:phycobilisome linker polypeptide [Anthocerotibacter panamensis]|uniref:CpcD n=1 Tax=Anthocerotibacter panamensis TaxID=2857077 RepID=A0AAJ6N6H2_9CYAN|nr:phycobilisome linker polypeptide [Anthocerotibacter panamensis]8IML_M Chain M, CpcD [Anthocerotibacter panamensis]8IML_Z Chain Z, CpcD [Anthocerotibacter panamensis]8IML_m Chain m, CpcD [Anthocerotibacter panamensis]8IMM_M Chain M, CpcD [Anthocerotibacter panamensis]8IMM_Z Chain Z, CpcD [Anthocerotibacter panamensis]8IMM_m Chain m, CpcD [Anthocerotibacter panamensis]8IMN_M Chain M, CpcD [Anthocerotibacter panamensis]8IMN_Z Chain Z, CpcD [Anthocerotibacter panamensis]8IMN_m Chain m, CpcD